MYILLDIDRIFGVKGAEKYEVQDVSHAQLPPQTVSSAVQTPKVQSPAPVSLEEALAANASSGENVRETAPSPDAGQSAPSEKAALAAALVSGGTGANDEPEFSFIADSLASFEKFYVSDVNEQWARKRYTEWKKNVQEQTFRF